MVTLGLTFWETANLLFKTSWNSIVSLTHPTRNWVSISPCPCQRLLLSTFLFIVGVKWYLTVILICTSLMTMTLNTFSWVCKLVFHHILVFCHYFKKYSFCLFLFSYGTPIMHMLVHLMVSHDSKALFIFLHSFYFLFLKLNANWLTFKFVDSFFCLLKSDAEHLSGILISVLLYFNSRI